MGIEVAEMAQVPVESATDVHNSFIHKKENGKLDQGPGSNEPIKFGSHGGESVNGEENNVSNANLPIVAEEWPAPAQIHSFYFVRFRLYEDPKIKAKIDLTDKEIQRRSQTRFRFLEELKVKRADRGELAAQMKKLKSEVRQYKSIMDEKKKEMEPLQQALGKLRTTNNFRSGGICSSEEELNDLIHSLQYRIQHESIPLSEEKQLLREIKQLEATREKVMANVAMRAKIQESMGQKEVIQDQVKLMGVDLDGVRKENQAVWAKISQLEGKMKVIDEEVKALQEELNDVTEKREKAFANIQELRKHRDEANACFFQYRQVLNKAKDLAVKKNVKALEEFAETEVEKFITLWKKNKAFRDDYEKRLLPSLDSRQLSRDGRIRNPDEKPLLAVEPSLPCEPEILPKLNVKQPKGDSKSATQKGALPIQKFQKDANNKETTKKTAEHSDISDKDILDVETPTPVKKVDEAKLKEMKREEEMAKAKQAMERKKKLAKKAAAKAAIRANMEAEKKEKEREKKAKKKAAANAPEESAEAVTEVEEPEEADVNPETPVGAPTRSRGPESLPKAILKRKKSTNYWVWAAPAALGVLLSLVLAYYLSSVKSSRQFSAS